MPESNGERGTRSVFRRHRKKTLLAVVVAMVLATEAGLRIVNPEIFAFVHAARQVHSYSSEWKVDLTPGRTAHLVLRGDDGEYLLNFLITTGRDGIRIPDRELDHALVARPGEGPLDGIDHVHCVGDSFAMGWGVSYAESFPGILDSLLPPERRAVNLAVDGFGAIAATEKAERLFATYPASDAVLLLHPSDFDDDEKLMELRARGSLHHLAHRLLDRLRKRTYLGNLPFAVVWVGRFEEIRQRDGRVRAKTLRLDGSPHVLSVPEIARFAGTVDESHPTLVRVAAYRDFLRAKGARLTVLVNSPMTPQGGAMLEFCRRQGIRVFPLEFPPEMLLAREGHLNQLGNHALARFVEELLAPLD